MAKKQAKKAVKKAVKKPAPKASKRPAAKTAKSAKTAKAVYFFGGARSDGDRSMRDLLGGKGANLAEMANAGLPVPPGFTITTAACMLW